VPKKAHFDFCEPWPRELMFLIERGRDRTGRVVDPDNESKRMLTDNKDVDTWVCILKAGICGVNSIETISNEYCGWAPDTRVGSCCGNSSMRDHIFRVFLQHGHDFISEYPDKTVQPSSTSTGQPEPQASTPISIRAKAHELFEAIIAFVLRTLPIYPIMIPHVPGLMWFGRSSPWEHKLAQDIDILGAAETPRFRDRAAADEPLKTGIHAACLPDFKLFTKSKI
jgi:hypothetical protein